MPFDPSRGLVEFTATVNGSTCGRFGIDTGADRLYLDRAFAARAGIKISSENPSAVVRGLKGTSIVGGASVRSFTIGDQALYNIPVEIIDIGALSDNQNAPDGLVGYDALSRFYITLDYPKQTINLFTTEPPFLRDKDAVFATVPFTLSGHFIMVKVVLDDGVVGNFFVDFCASVSVLSPTLLKSVGLSPDADDYVTIKRASIGDVTAKQVVDRKSVV